MLATISFFLILMEKKYCGGQYSVRQTKLFCKPPLGLHFQPLSHKIKSMLINKPCKAASRGEPTKVTTPALCHYCPAGYTSAPGPLHLLTHPAPLCHTHILGDKTLHLSEKARRTSFWLLPDERITFTANSLLPSYENQQTIQST